MTEWQRAFGSTPTTVRKAVETAARERSDLLDAMREFPLKTRRDQSLEAGLAAEKECESNCRWS
jgi:hypothetical protein